jgi:hypothetical protein
VRCLGIARFCGHFRHVVCRDPGRTESSNRKDVKVRSISFFQEVKLRPKKMVIIRSLGSDGSQWVAMAGKSLYRP